MARFDKTINNLRDKLEKITPGVMKKIERRTS